VACLLVPAAGDKGAEYSNTAIGVSLFFNGVQAVVSAALVVISHAVLSTRSTHT